jgi:hypothetical protein
MKTTICIVVFMTLTTPRIRAQAAEIEQLLLNVEKLAQLKQVLNDMKKSYDVLYKGYTTVKNIAEGNFNLHEAFINGLLEVSPTVKKYRRIVEIIQMQQQLLKEYKCAYQSAKASGALNLQEIEYTAKVYEGLVQRSLQAFNELVNVLTAGTYRMNDEQRMTKIDDIYRNMQEQLSFLGHFNSNNRLLILNRKKEQQDINTIRALQ